MGVFICTSIRLWHPLNTSEGFPSALTPVTASLGSSCSLYAPAAVLGEDGLGAAGGNNTMSMLLLQLEMNKHNKKEQLPVVMGQA